MTYHAPPKWWMKASRRHVGLLDRRPPGVPKPLPSWVVPEWQTFDAWAAWVDSGRRRKRPALRWQTSTDPNRVPQWAWELQGERQAARTRPAPPAAEQKPPPLPPPSWTLPGPFVMNASDPGAANNRPGVRTVGTIVDQIEACPLWECRPTSGGARGLCGQVEGLHQVDQCLELISRHRRPGDHLAIVGTLNVPADRLLAAGVNVCFFELNAQAGWEPYGNVGRMAWRAGQDGWPHRKPSYGVYVPVGLAAYGAYVPLVWDDGLNDWKRASKPQGLDPDCGIFSADGAGDTDSWPAIAALGGA